MSPVALVFALVVARSRLLLGLLAETELEILMHTDSSEHQPDRYPLEQNIQSHVDSQRSLEYPSSVDVGGRSKLSLLDTDAAANVECPTSQLPAMLHPGCFGAEDYEKFVVGMVERLQGRMVGEMALTHVLKSITPEAAGPGKLWMEFGVYSGSTTRTILNQLKSFEDSGVTTGLLYGCDSFAGLPKIWDKGYPGYSGYAAGAFKNTQHPFEDSHVVWVKGWFNESVPKFWNKDQGREGAVTFAHLDADLYESTASALQGIEARIAKGCILVFDDLVNYPAYREGELKALWEFFQRTRRPLEVLYTAGPEVQLNPNPNPNQAPGQESVAFRVH